MMKILLVSAVAFEIKHLLADNQLNSRFIPLITGPGIPATVYHLTRWLRSGEEKADLVLNAGLAGSFSEKFAPGSTVRVSSDCFGDLGAEDDDRFLHVSKMDFEPGIPAYPLQLMATSLPLSSVTLADLPITRAITVNKVHGREESIRKIMELYDPGIESMEGAAVFYVAEKENVPAIQIRSISNRVEKRDKSKWETDKAVLHLNGVLKKIILELTAA